MGNENSKYSFSLRESLTISRERGNIVPILADARKPEEFYYDKVVIYDI